MRLRQEGYSTDGDSKAYRVVRGCIILGLVGRLVTASSAASMDHDEGFVRASRPNPGKMSNTDCGCVEH